MEFCVISIYLPKCKNAIIIHIYNSVFFYFTWRFKVNNYRILSY